MKTTAYYYIDDNTADAHQIETNGETHKEAVIDLIDFWNSTVYDKVTIPFDIHSHGKANGKITTIVKGHIAARDENGEFTDKSNKVTIFMETDEGE